MPGSINGLELPELSFHGHGSANQGCLFKPRTSKQDMLDVKLVVVGGANEGDEFQLKLPATLGRGREATLPLPHPLVSRQHCELMDRDGLLVVRDLGSTNGTFVGSERVTESVLEHGQLLTIGTVTFRACLADLPHDLHGLSGVDSTYGESVPVAAADPRRETTALSGTETAHLPAAPRPIRVGHRAK